MDIDPEWLAATYFLDTDSPEVDEFAQTAAGTGTDETEVAINLFHAVRDGIRYDPYTAERNPTRYRASAIAGIDSTWCVPKSVLLTAAARNRGIPARLGFADVRNHLTSAKLQSTLGTDLFIWHGYSELLLEGRWLKLSSAFNIELCERFGVKVLEFDGTNDALMHPFDAVGNRHMEYVHQRGSFNDLPLEEMQTDFAKLYPNWMEGGSTGSSASAAADTAFS